MNIFGCDSKMRLYVSLRHQSLFSKFRFLTCTENYGTLVLNIMDTANPSPTSTDMERRASRRAPLAFPVEVTSKSGWKKRKTTGSARDVSPNGMQIASDACIPTGSKIGVRVDVSGYLPSQTCCELKGVVVWDRAAGNGSGFLAGVDFDPKKDIDIWRKLVYERLRRLECT